MLTPMRTETNKREDGKKEMIKYIIDALTHSMEKIEAHIKSSE